MSSKMNGDDPHANERQSLQTRLLDAVKQCQVRFGGRTELATETDARVSCLCSAWETVLQHGQRNSRKPLNALKQMTEIAGLTKVAGMFAEKGIETEAAFWLYVKEHLTKHEQDRFYNLKNISTDSGRGRAWLRAALNEHALERYMHMLIEDDELLGQHYESWAFLRDQEKSSMMPMMARGLDSILFAINVDNAELGAVRQTSATVINVGSVANAVSKQEDELRPVIAGESPPVGPPEKKKEKKKKKKIAHIVSFDEDDSGRFSKMDYSGYSRSRSRSGSSPTLPSVLATESSARTVSDSVPVSAPVVQSVGDSQKVDQSLLRSTSRDPSIASGRSEHLSDTRRSQGSFSSADFELSSESNMSVMMPLSPSGGLAIDDDNAFSEGVASRSRDSSFLSSYGGEDMQTATFALQQVQKVFHDSQRTQGDGGNVSEEKSDNMSTDELKKAVVSMMLRKDEVEEQNRSLKQMLEQEMETSSVLRAEIEQMKHSASMRQEKEQAKLQTLQKENELLKHQLRKYVNAVQMLRTEGSKVDENLGIHVEEPQPTIPPAKPLTDYSHEAEEYERKLIQVAEMHGELMEFNELLHRQIMVKDHFLKRLQMELVDLRGPLPHDLNFTDDPLSMGMESLAIQTSSNLINIWIPSAFLRGSTSDRHHVYQVYVRIRDEEWNVYKRYKEFDELHQLLKKKFPLTSKYDFPKKKSFGKKDAKVVESRRRTLQDYLRNVINHVLEKNKTLAINVCKQNLLTFLPFFGDKPAADKKTKQKKPDGQRSPLSSSPQQTETTPAQYSGL